MQTEINNSTIHTPQPDLPPGWRWVRLGEVCEINPPRTKNFKRLPDTPTTFIPMATVNERTGTVADPEVVPYSRVSKGYTYFEENDVLFAKITPCMQNGKHIIARNLIDGIGFGTTEFHVLRSNNEILSEWIYFFIRQPYFLQEATAYFTGAVGQQRVPESFLSNYIIPLPPIEEQKRITTKLQELLQEVERARTAAEKQLGAANSLSTAYLRKVFESEEAKKWERKKLGEVCDIHTGKRDVNEGAEGGKYLFFTCAAEPLKSNTFSFEGKSIILPGNGANVGLVLFYDDKFEAYQRTYVLNNFDCLPEYVFYNLKVFWKEHNMDKQSGSATNYIRLGNIQNYPIAIPSFEIQQRIADELKEKMAEVEKLRTSIEKQLETINALPQVILRKAFRGEL